MHRVRTARPALVVLAGLASALVAACGPGRAPIVDVTPIPDTTDTVGPYRLTVVIQDDGEIRSARVRWFTDAIHTPQPLDLVRDGESDRYTAGLPGQPAGTQVRYLVEVEDDEGRLVTQPPAARPDEPLTTFTFTILGSP